MNLKEKYQRFRKWQREPFHYENKNQQIVRCANCGTEHDGNFCPICGQKAGVGRISWQTVRQGVMLIWGMDSRSLGYSLLQLILRPGYLISDYLSGKRQVSFPPVKMLLLVAIGVLLAQYVLRWFFPEVPEETAASSKVIDVIFDSFGDWFEANPGWGMLSLSSLLILPTWLIFRYAPRHDRHTLPEGFFIQVFMSTLMLLISILDEILDGFFLLIIFFLYFIAYLQLFGYRIWGTLWRVVLCFFVALGELAIIMYGATYIYHIFHPLFDIRNINRYPGIIVFVFVLCIATVAIANFISKRTEKRTIRS